MAPAIYASETSFPQDIELVGSSQSSLQHRELNSDYSTLLRLGFQSILEAGRVEKRK